MPPGLSTGFQSFVNKELPPGVAGDFAGANIKASIISSPWGYVASAGGLIAGLIGWANPASNVLSAYFQPNSICGFVHRESQGTITQYLGVATMAILGGKYAVAYDLGEFWGLFNSGGSAGQKVYTTPAVSNGALSYGLTAAATGASVALTGGSATIAGNVMTVTVAPSPANLAVGQIISMAGVPAGTFIASLGSGTGGTGTYNLSNYDGAAIPAVGSATAFTAYGAQETQFYLAENVTADCLFTASLAVPAAGLANGVLTVTAIASGVLAPGQWLSATGGGGLPGSANVQILQQLTGSAGGTGTYLTTNVNYTVTSTNTFDATQGKLGKISSLATWW